MKTLRIVNVYYSMIHKQVYRRRRDRCCGSRRRSGSDTGAGTFAGRGNRTEHTFDSLCYVHGGAARFDHGVLDSLIHGPGPERLICEHPVLIAVTYVGAARGSEDIRHGIERRAFRNRTLLPVRAKGRTGAADPREISGNQVSSHCAFPGCLRKTVLPPSACRARCRQPYPPPRTNPTLVTKMTFDGAKRSLPRT